METLNKALLDVCRYVRDSLKANNEQARAFKEEIKDLDEIIEEAEKPLEHFEITSVARQDLEEAGFDTSKVDDDTMKHLASKMADSYCDNGFWIALEIIAEALEIPAKAKK